MNIFGFCPQILKSCIKVLFLCMLILASSGIFTAQAQVALDSNSLAVPGIDLDVTYINRTPRYNWDAVKQWPAVGETVTFTAQVINKGTNASGSFSFQWLLDGQIIGSGTSGSLAPQAQTTISRTWSWQTGRHSITIKADPQNQIVETAENNNLISDFTDALSVGFWVEQSVYNQFNNTQNGRGTYSWEDWAQHQIMTFNELLQQSQLPLAPQGVLTRLRLDKIVIVPDNTLANLNPQHAPYETATDVQWGFAVQEYFKLPLGWLLQHFLECAS